MGPAGPPGRAVKIRKCVVLVGPRPILSKFDGPSSRNLMGRAGPRPMRCGLCMGRTARPMRRPMCLTGRPGSLPVRCGVLLLLLLRPPCPWGRQCVLARAVAHEMWCTTATITTFWGVSGSLSTKNNYVRTMHYWQIASGIIQYFEYNMMPRANVGAKPWYRCGCTDDTPCRLGDAGSMTFLPWFVPWTEPPVQLREDRVHVLTDSCSDVPCVSMSNRG